MDRELYFQCPRPFYDNSQCCQALKAAEGSKQAGHLYYEEHSKCHVEKLGAERSPKDPNCYKIIKSDSMWIYYVLLVDNCLLLPSGKPMLDWFLAEYRKYYTVTGGDITTKFNGVYYDQSQIHKGIIKIHQKPMIEAMYKKYLPMGTRPRTSPFEPTGAAGAKVFMKMTGAETDEDKALAKGLEFMNIVGAIAYLTAKTRYDCRFHSARLGQHLANWSKQNFEAALTLLSYLYHTRELGITKSRKIRKCVASITFVIASAI